MVEMMTKNSSVVCPDIEKTITTALNPNEAHALRLQVHINVTNPTDIGGYNYITCIGGSDCQRGKILEETSVSFLFNFKKSHCHRCLAVAYSRLLKEISKQARTKKASWPS